MTNNSKESDLSRREFLRRYGIRALFVADVGLYGSFFVEAFRREQLKMQNYGKFLSPENESFRFTNEPTILQVILIPSKADLSDQEEIILRRNPHFLFSQELRMDPKEVNINYAVPVFGEAFGDWKYSRKGGRNSLEVIHDGERILGGQWLMISDVDGNPVDPQGQKIDSKTEKPFYTANNFTVLA